MGPSPSFHVGESGPDGMKDQGISAESVEEAILPLRSESSFLSLSGQGLEQYSCSACDGSTAATGTAAASGATLWFKESGDAGGLNAARVGDADRSCGEKDVRGRLLVWDVVCAAWRKLVLDTTSKCSSVFLGDATGELGCAMMDRTVRSDRLGVDGVRTCLSLSGQGLAHDARLGC